jgi:hypothetical protein
MATLEAIANSCDNTASSSSYPNQHRPSEVDGRTRMSTITSMVPDSSMLGATPPPLPTSNPLTAS